MKDQQIVFSDIDGTLLNANRALSQSTISEIKRIKNTIPVVLVSARMPKAMEYLQNQLGIMHQPMICYNGGLILWNNLVQSSTYITTNILNQIADFDIHNKLHISLYYKDEWYVPQMDKWALREQHNTKVTPTVKPIKEVINTWAKEQKGAHKMMCMGAPEEIDAIAHYLSSNFKDQLQMYRSKDTYLEVSDKSISKLTAIEWLLANHFKTSLDHAIAFGDNYNDVNMISSVGTGVAVANARPEVLEVADYITQEGKDDGVANFIKKNL